jgi:hypothetical protein
VLWIAATALVLGLVLVVIWFTRSKTAARWRAARLLAEFARHRPQLEADFLQTVSKLGKPRGLDWQHIEWQGPVFLAWDRPAGQYVALIEIAVQFAAREGGEMEGVDAVALAKSGTARFVWSGRHWLPVGRVLFNLAPEDVLRQFTVQLAALGVGADVNQVRQL